MKGLLTSQSFYYVLASGLWQKHVVGFLALSGFHGPAKESFKRSAQAGRDLELGGSPGTHGSPIKRLFCLKGR